ncbi:MAG: metal-dependent hydrolase [Clostridiaceae bacterium]|jgi:L-ascorbate metabolism protein UlaG (beta-lactamase superfamily)|nr:metal-dependent hydrolase [Clostridiaceae bacterium]
MVDLKYIGHSAVEIKTKDTSILVDPYVSVNPNYDYTKIEKLSDIFLTHGHGDHLGEAIEIAKKKKATITAVFELAKYCEEQKCKTRDVGLGSWINYEWGRAVFLPAFHSSSLPDGGYAGCAASILFDVEGVRIYHAGDTCLNSEMKIVKELYRPNIALLPIGGTYTMDVEHAAVAAQWIGAQTVIPIHYGTFPSIQADLQKFAQLVQIQNTNCCILNPDEIKQ